LLYPNKEVRDEIHFRKFFNDRVNKFKIIVEYDE